MNKKEYIDGIVGLNVFNFETHLDVLIRTAESYLEKKDYKYFHKELESLTDIINEKYNAINNTIREIDKKANEKIEKIKRNKKYKELNKEIEKITGTTNNKENKIRTIEPNEVELAILKFESERIFKKINIIKMPPPDKKNTETWKGQCCPNQQGAEIKYSSQTDQIDAHIIIAHEIGHLILHMSFDDRLERNLKEFNAEHSEEDNIMEIEASYFAERILIKLMDSYKSNKNVENEQIENKDNNEIITYEDKLRERITNLHKKGKSEYDISKLKNSTVDKEVEEFLQEMQQTYAVNA